MIKLHPSRLLMTVAMTAAFAIPLPSLAATPTRQQNQDSLNAALGTLTNGTSFVADSQANVQARVRSTGSSNGMSGTINAAIGAFTRVQPQADGGSREESNVSVKSITVQPTGSSSAFPVDGTLTVRTKVVSGRLYIMIDSVPPMVAAAMRQMGLDPAATGKWVVFDQGAAGGLFAPLMAPLQPLMQPNLWPRAIAGRPNVFTITKVEKVWKADNGDDLFRARVTLNPTVVTALKNAEIAHVGATDPNRKALLADIRTRYAKLQPVLEAMQFVVEVDRSTNTLRRLEIGGILTQPIKTCTTATSKTVSVCKTTSNITARFNVGTWFRTDTGPLIVRPTRRSLDIAATK